MRMEQYLTFTDHALWEVIVNGDSVLPVASASAGVEGHIPPKTAKQNLARKNELKAKSTLMSAIPDEHLLKFHACKDEKSLWEAIKNSQEGPDKTYDRFQKLISQLEIHDEVVSQEDENLKLLRSLPSAWNNISLIMRNKFDLDKLSMDDLYNNLKVYESEIKGQSSSSSNSQIVAFVTLDNSSSTNETINTSHSVSAASSKDQASTASYADDISNGKWQVAMLTIRVKRFIKKTRRKLDLNGKETLGFDRTKVECYNCHRRGHFSREYWAPRNHGNRNRDAPTWNAPVDTSTTNALVVQDGIGSSSSDSVVHNGSKECLKSYEALQKQYDQQREALNKFNLEIIGLVLLSLDWESDSEDENVFKSKEVKKIVKPSLEKIEFVNARNTTVENEKKAAKPRKFTTVLTKSGQVPVNAVKQSTHRAATSASAAKRVNTAASRPNGNQKYALHDQGSFDSGCSRHMTGNKFYLTYYQEIDGGFVAFGGNAKGGIENQMDHKVKTIRCDNETEFKNRIMNDFCEIKGDKNDQEKDVRDQEEALRKKFEQEFERLFGQEEASNTNKTNRLDTVSSPVNAVSSSFTNVDPGRERAQRNEFKSMFGQYKDANGNSTYRMFTPVNAAGSSYVNLIGLIPVNAATLRNDDLPTYPFMPNLEDAADLQDTRIFSGAYDDEVEGALADFNSLELTIVVSLIPTTRIHKDHPKKQIIKDPLSTPQTRRMTKTSQEHAMHAIGTKWVYINKKDERGIVVRNKARLVAQGHTQEEGINYDEVFYHVARIEAIGLFLAYASFMRFIVYQMDVKSAFLYGTIEEEVAWYETLSTYLLENGFRRRIIDKTLFIKKDKVKTAITLIETNKALLKDEEVEDVDVHLYRSMIGSLMYLTASRPDIIYLKGQPKLGLWYPRNSPFDLEAFSDSDYVVARFNRKSTTGVVNFLARDSFHGNVRSKLQNGISDEFGVKIGSCKVNDARLDLVLLGEKFIDQHNMVACLERTDGNAEFHQIVDFLTISPIHYALAVSPNIYTFYIEQFWATAKSKTVNDVKQIHATVDGKTVIISESSVRSDIHFNDEDEQVTTIASQPQKTHTPRQAKRSQDNKIPQSSGPPKKVGDEAVCTGEDDRVVKAATTATSLEAEQESEFNTSRTREDSMEHQDDLMDFVPPTPHDSPLSGGHTPGSDEGRPNINELMAICTQLSKRKELDKENVSKQGRNLKISPMFEEGNIDDDFDDIVDMVDEAIETVKGVTVNVGGAVNTATTRVSAASASVTTAGVSISTAEPRTPPTTTITAFEDEDPTIAQKHVKMRSKKAKEKGVAFRDVKESVRPTTILPTIDPKDKGKGIMQDPEKPPKNPRMAQIQLDEELAKRMHEEEMAKFEKRQSEIAAEEEASKATIKAAINQELDDIQTTIKANEQMASRLQYEEQE
nr:hypothetical protein [Tanacetum cinerariifolium]